MRGENGLEVDFEVTFLRPCKPLLPLQVLLGRGTILWQWGLIVWRWGYYMGTRWGPVGPVPGGGQ